MNAVIAVVAAANVTVVAKYFPKRSTITFFTPDPLATTNESCAIIGSNANFHYYLFGPYLSGRLKFSVC